MFRQDCTCPALLEDPCCAVPYGAITRCGAPFQTLPLPTGFVTSRQSGRPGQAVPQPPSRNARRLSHVTGLASSPFAHHY